MAQITAVPGSTDNITLVAHEGQSIRGFTVACDLSLELDDTGIIRRCFFIGATCVDERFEGGHLASELLFATRAILNQRRNRHHYDALVIFSGYDGQFDERLMRSHYQQVPNQPMLWFRHLS